MCFMWLQMSYVVTIWWMLVLKVLLWHCMQNEKLVWQAIVLMIWKSRFKVSHSNEMFLWVKWIVLDLCSTWYDFDLFNMKWHYYLKNMNKVSCAFVGVLSLLTWNDFGLQWRMKTYLAWKIILVWICISVNERMIWVSWMHDHVELKLVEISTWTLLEYKKWITWAWVGRDQICVWLMNC